VGAIGIECGQGLCVGATPRRHHSIAHPMGDLYKSLFEVSVNDDAGSYRYQSPSRALRASEVLPPRSTTRSDGLGVDYQRRSRPQACRRPSAAFCPWQRITPPSSAITNPGTKHLAKVSTESRDFQSLHCHLPLHAHANLSGIGAISRFTIALRCLLRSAVVQRRGPDCQSQADAREKMMGPDGGERQAANATRDASRGVAATYDGSIVDPFPMYAQYRRGEPVIEDWASARESTPASAGRRPGSKSN
jgi:hypothetical protein